MEIADLITPRGVIAQLRAANKKQALQELAKRGRRDDRHHMSARSTMC